MTGRTWSATETERRVWQLAAAKLLTELLLQAHTEQLPPVTWTVGPAGASLTARCNTRADWTRWVRVLGITEVRPEQRYGGLIHLRAGRDVRRTSSTWAHVAVIAALDPAFESETADPHDAADHG